MSNSNLLNVFGLSSLHLVYEADYNADSVCDISGQWILPVHSEVGGSVHLSPSVVAARPPLCWDPKHKQQDTMLHITQVTVDSSDLSRGPYSRKSNSQSKRGCQHTKVFVGFFGCSHKHLRVFASVLCAFMSVFVAVLS